MHIFRQMLLGAAAAVAALASPAGADTISGIRAWERGDFAAAVKEFRAAAEKGDADAQFNLGQAYRMGRGVPADPRIAQSWYQKAAAQGHDRAGGNLGLMLYESGNRREALPWIRKAAEQGDSRAQYVMGIELTNGDLIAKDWPRAYAYMTRAASQGLPAAARSLGQMEQFVPPAERQKGIAIARQMERGTAGAAPVPVIKTAGAAPSKKPVAAAKAPAPAARPAPVAAVAMAGGSGWRAQLGAYGSPAAAQAQWVSLSRRIPALGGLKPSYEKAGALTRLRAGPLASRAAVDKVCASAKAAGQPCFPVAP